MAGMRTSGFWASARKVGCDTRAAVISTMRSCLEQYMEERGFGVVLFMLSVVSVLLVSPYRYAFHIGHF